MQQTFVIKCLKLLVMSEENDVNSKKILLKLQEREKLLNNEELNKSAPT
ncbi:hypothetical protein [Cytobacillus praedii]|nr:hypothetical protein [Cytobacillus praedii]